MESYDLTEKSDLLQTEQEMDTCIPTSSLPNEICYYSELRSIMYAFGDVKTPLESSVKMMHNILQSQMTLLIKKAEDVMKLRKRKKISHEEVLFLMRKNKVLLKRLFQFLFVEDAKTCFKGKKLHEGFSPENGKKVSECLKYLAFIEKFDGDLTSILRNKNIIDYVYLKRLKRRDLMTDSMTKEEYLSFCEFTLKITFCQKYAKERFMRWLQQCSGTTTDITPLALLIIHFLARETVAGIIDKALEIKSRKFDSSDHFQLENFCDPVDVFCESEHDLEEPKMNSQLPLPETSEDGSCYQNLKNFPVNTSEKNKIAESNSTNSSFHCPIAIDRKEGNMTVKSNNTDNLINDKQKKGTIMMSSHLQQNSFSKTHANDKSDSNSDTVPSKRKKSDSSPASDKILYSNTKKNKTNSHICDNVKCPNTNHVVDKDVSSECRTDKVFSNSHSTSKKVSKKSNFQEELFSNMSKTFEIDTNSAVEDRFNKTTDTQDKGLTTSCFVEYIEKCNSYGLKTRDSDSTNFGKHSGQSLIIPIETNAKVYWFPDEAITPEEIQAAFIYYQQSSPLSWFIKTRFCDLEPRKTNLVCLINPDDFV